MGRQSSVLCVLAFVNFVFGAALTACSDDERARENPEGGAPAHGTGGARSSFRDADVVTRDAGTASHDARPVILDAASSGHGEDVAVIGVAPCTGTPPVMKVRNLTTNTEFEADWSCYDFRDGGAPDADAGAADASTRLATMGLEPLPPSLVGRLTADLFFETSTLGVPSMTRVFDVDAGMVTFPVPQGLRTLSAHLHGTSPSDPAYAVAEFHEYGLPVPATGEPVMGFVMLAASRTLSINLALGGGKEDAAKAVVISLARDCSGQPVSGAQFELVDGETNRPVATGADVGAPHSSYARFAIPSTTCTFTTNEQTEASWMMVNAPVNVTGTVKTHPYRVRFMGRRRASDVAPVVLREREIELFSGGTTYVRLDR